MIIKLMPEQISSLWDSIRYGLLHTMAPTISIHDESIKDILSKLLMQDMQCWCVYDADNNIYGYIVTSISIDTNTNSRTLLMYSLYLHAKVPTELWDRGMEVIEEYAKINNCTKISAYTKNPDVVSIASKYGFDTSITYVTKNIGE